MQIKLLDGPMKPVGNTKEEIHDGYPSTRRLFVVFTAFKKEQERRMWICPLASWERCTRAGNWTETTEPFALSVSRALSPRIGGKAERARMIVIRAVVLKLHHLD